jgi:hypothetical protein
MGARQLEVEKALGGCEFFLGCLFALQQGKGEGGKGEIGRVKSCVRGASSEVVGNSLQDSVAHSLLSAPPIAILGRSQWS